MSNISNINILPKEILLEIFNYTGKTNIGPVCNLWNEVYQNTLNKSLLKALPGLTYNENNTNSPTTTELIKHLFQKAMESGTTKEANEIILLDAPLHMKLSEIQACNEQAQIHAYNNFIENIDHRPKDAPALIKEQQLPFIQELTELKKLFNSLDLQNLTYLDLTNSHIGGRKIKMLPSEIGNLLALKELDLSGNQLITVPPEIGNLKFLISLNLSDNQFKTLPSEVYNLLLALTYLDLACNEFKTFPSEVCNLVDLENLELSGNQFITVPPEIGNLLALIMVQLSCNQLTTVPPEIGNLLALKGLYLSENQLTTVPPEIGNLLALEDLDLSKNQLTTVPPEIGNLLDLTELDLSDNQLTTVPAEIGNLLALKELDLCGNQLETLPAELVKLSVFPSIEDNPIEYLPSQLIPKVLEKYEAYAFNLSFDIQRLNDFYYATTLFNDLPIRLQNLIKQPADTPPLLSKMCELERLKTNFVTSKNLDALVQILTFPTDGLHEQQIVEVVLELFSNLEDENPLKLEINQAVATALGLDLEEEPGVGLEKFLFRPLAPEIKQTVIALQGNDNSSQAAYALLSKEQEKNSELLRENSSLKRKIEEVSILKNTINTQELKLEQAKEYEETLEKESKKVKEELQSKISSVKEQLLEKEEKEIYQKRKDAFLIAGIDVFSQNGELLKHLSTNFNEQYWNHIKLVYKEIINFDAIEQEHPLQISNHE